MSHHNGPNEGNWSVFASKVVEERDEALAKLAAAEADTELVCTNCFASESDNKQGGPDPKIADYCHDCMSGRHVRWTNGATKLVRERELVLHKVFNERLSAAEARIGRLLNLIDNMERPSCRDPEARRAYDGAEAACNAHNDLTDTTPTAEGDTNG